ncbi:hypothetical protein CEP52_017595 [Fusarium oligoseptatum]|uniref:Uncharacterized protein n=1 Tax=Fusarium oligoseptatum TaxID=2604345 RepID=A0A428RMT0_9HYPO|nr:hypothetical protein CEP52_017595 [Fusarium oligoseptatum]
MPTSSKPEPTPAISSPPTATSTFAFGTPTVVSESLPPSACLSSMCPQMLSAASFGNPPTTFLFGRGADQAIWYRQADEQGWITRWTSLGGAFVSPPTSLSIRKGRIDVFAVDESQEVRFKTFQEGKWPSATSFGVDKLSLVCVDADHRPQLKYYKGHWGPKDSVWQDLGDWLFNTPALASGALDRVDMVGYGVLEGQTGGAQRSSNHSMIYKRYNTTGWLDWEGGWGSFKGDPGIAAVANDQIEYFGVDRNGAMWHNAWLPTERPASASVRHGTNLTNLPPEYTDPENLGGNFTSAPFTFATDKLRLDVLAVGIDGRLKHQSRIGKSWAGGWEDLGGHFESAPLALTLGNAREMALGKFTLSL